MTTSPRQRVTNRAAKKMAYSNNNQRSDLCFRRSVN